MSKEPAAPITPNKVEIVDFSGANTKAHKAKKAHNRVVTVTNTIWNPLSDIAIGVKII